MDSQHVHAIDLAPLDNDVPQDSDLGAGDATVAHGEFTESTSVKPLAAGPVRRVEFALWLLFPLVGLAWLASRYSRHWYFRDEWAMIRSTTENGLVGGAFEGFLGHLFALAHVVYRIQTRWLDLESHEFVYTVFSLSVVAVQLSMAAVLRKLGASAVVALSAGSLIAFFGPGAEAFTFQFQLSQNSAIALTATATFLILGGERSRPSLRRAIAIGLIMSVCVGVDSGLAIVGLTLAVVVIGVIKWPVGRTTIAIIPAVIANAAWQMFGQESVHLRTTTAEYLDFGWHLLYESAAGFSGYSGPIAGIAVLIVANGVIVYGLWTRRLPRRVVALLSGGFVSGTISVAAITWTRAYLVPPGELGGRNYVSYVAFFFFLGYMPALVATLGSIATNDRWHLKPRVRSMFATVVVALIFTLGVDDTTRSLRLIETAGAISREEVRQAATLILFRCGDFGLLNPEGYPSPALSPTLTVSLIQYLQDRGKLSPLFGTMPTPVIIERVCFPPS